MRKAKPVILSDSDHTTLEQWTRSRMLPAPQVERAHIVVLAARGRQDKAITGELGVSSPQGRAAGASVFWPAASTPWRAKIHGPGASRASTRRPWCNAPPAPGVFEVPRSSGRADAGGSRRASDRGQRCAAPARQGGSVAQEASALFGPLHADQRVMVEQGGAVLPGLDRAARAGRSVSQRGGTGTGHHRLHPCTPTSRPSRSSGRPRPRTSWPKSPAPSPP